MFFLYIILIAILAIYIYCVAKGMFNDSYTSKGEKIKRYIISSFLIILFILSCSSISNYKKEINSLKDESNSIQNEFQSQLLKCEDDNASQLRTIECLNNENKKAKDYLNLNDNEKSIVDKKIQEVKKATEEEKAKAKAELEKKEAELKKKEAEAKAKKEAEEKAKEEAEEKAKKEAEAKKYDTGITWEDMARDKNGKYGSYTRLTGKIIQVINGDGFNQYRLAVNDDYNKIILIEININKLSKNIIEDDHITVEGMCSGNITYNTVLGAKNTIPGLIVDNFYY